MLSTPDGVPAVPWKGLNGKFQSVEPLSAGDRTCVDCGLDKRELKIAHKVENVFWSVVSQDDPLGKMRCKWCLKDQRAKAGLCVLCATKNKEPKFRLCGSCRAYHNKPKYQAQLASMRKGRVAQGKCRCGRDKEDAKKAKCETCLEVVRKGARERRKAKKLREGQGTL